MRVSSYRVRRIIARVCKLRINLTQNSVSEHDINSGPQSPTPPPSNDNSFGLRFSTNRAIVYVDSNSSESCDFTPHPLSPSTNDNIGSQIIMESSPNSGPETTRVPLHTITRDVVLEHCVLTRAIDHWFEPKYET